MFNKDFYPTPTKVLNYISDKYFSLGAIHKDTFINNYHEMNILEPSAGSGNIVEFLKDLRIKKENIFACEKEDKLLDILQGKCNIIGNNFLSLEERDVCHIDLVVANPPFSCFKQHFIHLISIVPNGTKIICLCNYDSCMNGRASSIQEILNQYGGTIENLGDVFSEAERSTNINIGLIYLQKGEKDEDFDFSGYFSEETDEYEHQEHGIMSYDYVREVVNRYVEACKNWKRIKAEQDKMNSMIKEMKVNSIEFKAVDSTEGRREILDFNQFKNLLQIKCWDNIFNEMKMGKYLTKQSRIIIEQYVKTQTKFPFTMKNVYNMIRMIVGTQADRMKDAVLEAFDNISAFSYEKNTSKGYKTNSDYCINKKFIMDSVDCNGYGSGLSLSKYSLEQIADIEKALCFLSAKNFDNINRFVDAAHEGYGTTFGNDLMYDNLGKWVTSEFFRFKIYKKGSCHFEFLDENIWARFNQMVAKERGWALPDIQKRKRKANNKF